MEAYKTVLVIGNGFDINLGLETSYESFMAWLGKDPKGRKMYLYKYLKEQQSLSGWTGIENELRNYSKSILCSTESLFIIQSFLVLAKRNTFKREYHMMCEYLIDYLRIQQEQYSMKMAKKTEAMKLLDELEHKYGYIYIVNFNYTNILDGRSNHFVHHVHGSLDKGQIVFGVEDGENINKRHLFLYKSYNPILNVDHLDKRFEDAENIVFFGYSLGRTDHSYFDDFFKQQSTAGCKRKRFDFYYYGQDAYDDLYWQLRTLTDKRVAKLKHFNDVNFINIKK